MATTEQKEPVEEPEEEEMGGLDDGDDENLTLISSEDDNPRKFEISESLKDFFDKLCYFFCSLFMRSTTSGVRFTFSSALSKASKA